jgi:DNA polymerase (family X)
VAAKDLTNAEIADRLSLFAALLELAETNRFAVRAYVRAAELVRSTPASVAELVRTGRVRELRGVGSGIEAKLRELVETGHIAELDELNREIQPEIVGYGRFLGLTAKRVLDIARALDVRTAVELEAAIRGGRLQEAPGVGASTEARIRAALERERAAPRGLTMNRSRALSAAIAAELGGEMAGPARRYCELAHELAVVCAADDPEAVLGRFQGLAAIVAVIERDENRTVGVTVEGVPVTLVVAKPASFGTELLRATGSPEYVQALEPVPDARDEASVFEKLGIPYCPPELRERPLAEPPRDLVERSRIRGDLHCHTLWSDGRATVQRMALAALERGYEYLAICDHSPNVGVVHGLDTDELRRQGEEIAEVNEGLAPFRVLRGVECDIRADGTLDVEDAVLAELDWVQLSLHAGQRRPANELTRMVTEAMRHPAVRALSHPKGRILNHRPENALDLDEVFSVAKETGVAVEVNGLPDRIDLSSVHVEEALAAGVDLVLNSDAHSERGLESLDLALATARKGGATVGSVVNCRPASDLRGGVASSDYR